MDNMEIYEKARSVPDNAKKQFDNGTFKGTDINPMWRIKKLTELFGAAGIGWYYEIISERSETHHDTTMAIVDINLYVKVDGEWSKPIYGTGGNALVKNTRNGLKASDEGYKMALTDALSVACKALGIGADVYFEKDKTKYSDSFEKPLAQEESKGMATDKERKRIWAIALKKGIEKPGDWIQAQGCSYNKMTTEDYVKLAGALNGYESQSA